MIVIAALLVAGAVALAIGAVVAGGDSVAVDAFGLTVDTTLWGVFLAGAVAALALLAALALFSIGTRQVRARRREVKELRRKVARLEGDDAAAEEPARTDQTTDATDERTDRESRV